MTMIRVTLLGTSAAQPTIRRGLSAIAVRMLGDHLLVDCGEGTQRQMLKYGVGLRLDRVLFTHFHADHYLGIVGLLRTLSMGERDVPLELCGPAPFVSEVLPGLITTGIEGLSFPVSCRPLSDGDVIRCDGYTIRAVQVIHRVSALGYVLEEDPRPGRFDVGAAQRLGVPPGPLYGRLQAGQCVELPDGSTVTPEQVLGERRRGRKVGLSGDTRPSEHFARASQGADLLIHEATFSENERERAELTQHSTALEAARIATLAEARQLVLTHLSSRFDTAPQVLFDEARSAYDGELSIAEDGLSLEVPLTEGD